MLHVDFDKIQEKKKIFDIKRNDFFAYIKWYYLCRCTFIFFMCFYAIPANFVKCVLSAKSCA